MRSPEGAEASASNAAYLGCARVRPSSLEMIKERFATDMEEMGRARGRNISAGIAGRHNRQPVVGWPMRRQWETQPTQSDNLVWNQPSAARMELPLLDGE
jgi:hypothetical protein